MMLPRLATLVCSLTLVAALPACQGKAPAKQDAKAAAVTKAPTDAKAADAKVADTKVADTKVTDTKVADAKVADAKAPPPTAPPTDADPLGSKRVDPGWFRKSMFGDKGKVLDTKRSEADDQGRFSSLIRFELTDMTTEACADHIEGLVKGDITNLERQTKDGRVQLRGSAGELKATFLCGTAEGKTIAYVSYQWT